MSFGVTGGNGCLIEVRREGLRFSEDTREVGIRTSRLRTK